MTANYIAPDQDVTLELILFTLDGKTNGGPGINARLTGFAYDDDENPTSAALIYDCMTVVSAEQVFGANIRRDVAGHLVGHLEFTVDAVSRFDVHELLDTPDRVRFAPSHGWVLQTLAEGGSINGGESPANGLIANGATMDSNGAWARTLSQGDTGLSGFNGDTPSLNTETDLIL